MGRPSRHPRTYALALLVPVLCACLAVAGADAERTQKGAVVSFLDGSVSPSVLPRERLAPISLHLGGGLRTDDGSLLPRVSRLEIAIAGRSAVLDTRGLPRCTRAELANTMPGEALAACGPALVGRGTIESMLLVPHQSPLPTTSRLLAFNAVGKAGGRAILLAAYSAHPPSSVVVPFAIRRRPGRFNLALVADLSRALGPLPRFMGVEIDLGRRYSYRGRPHSYLSASCPAPANFPGGFLSIAKATYSLPGGRHLATEIVRGCRAR